MDHPPAEEAAVVVEKLKLPTFEPEKPTPDANLVKLSAGTTYYEVRQQTTDSGTSSTNTSNSNEKEQPVVVCLHGIAWWSFSFHFLADCLVEKGFKVLIFDFYGRGRSSVANGGNYTPELLLSQTEELLEKLGFQKNLFVIGHSMGGIIASMFAAKHHEKVSKLVLMSPAVVPVAVPLMGRLVVVPVIGWPLFKLFGKGALLSKLHKDRFSDNFAHPEKCPEIIDQLVERMDWAIQKKEGYIEMFQSTLAHFPFQHGCLHEIEKIGKNNTNALLLWGNMDEVTPYKFHNMVTEKAPQMKFITIEDSSHAINLDAHEQTHLHILTFLKE